MTINFEIFYPGGNTTALINQPIPSTLRARVALSVMRHSPAVEQVGFLSARKNKLKLDMMGNELCINAAQCAAFYWHASTTKKIIKFKIPSLKQPLQSIIKNDLVRLKLSPKVVLSSSVVPLGHLVDMAGIRYLILDSGKSLNRNSVLKIIKKYAAGFPAVGLIQIQKIKSHISIRPWVWVKATNTLVLETACGSGSIAAAFFLRGRNPKQKMYVIHQPSKKNYRIEFDKSKITIETQVKRVGNDRLNLKSL